MSQMLDAVLSCDLRQIKQLLTNVKEINNPIAKTGRLTLLHVASGIQNLKIQAIVSYLLNCGANPNASADEGLTPVHISAMWNNLLTLEKLLVFGGDPWLQDFEQKDAFDLAAETNAQECLGLLNTFKFRQCENIKDLQLTCENTSICNELHSEYGSCVQNVSEVDQLETSIRNQITISNPTHNTTFTKNEGCHFVNSEQLIFENKHDSTKKSAFCPQTCEKLDMRAEKCSFTSIFSSDGDSNSDTFKSLSSLKSLIMDKALEKKSHISTDRRKETLCKSGISDEKSLSLSQESICSTVSESSTVVEIIHTDKREGIVLIEQRFLSIPTDSIVSGNNQSCDSDCSSKSDWKFYQTAYQALSSDSSASFEVPVKIPSSLLSLSNSEIFEKLKQLGDDPGPILNTTRYIYLLRLAKLTCGTVQTYSLPQQKFPEEVYLFLDDKLDLMKIQKLEQEISMEFDKLTENSQLGDGNQRRSFTYFLLDPRVTKGLPNRSSSLSLKEMFMIFIDSLFYVGKGTSARPFCHLYEAAKAINSAPEKQQNLKVRHILDIWQSGLGVVSLHCFQNCISVEAFTREACIIEAIGLSNLTNIRKGHYYGTAAKLTMSKKKQLGILYLSYALEIFLLEGERLIRLRDVA